MDDALLAFVKDNLITIGLVLYFLNGLAKLTKWDKDDKVVALLSGMFNMIRPVKKNKEVTQQSDVIR
jgi:hypothetical protein